MSKFKSLKEKAKMSSEEKPKQSKAEKFAEEIKAELKNKKIFLVVVAHFLRCANTTDFVDRQNS